MMPPVAAVVLDMWPGQTASPEVQRSGAARCDRSEEPNGFICQRMRFDTPADWQIVKQWESVTAVGRMISRDAINRDN